MEMGYHGTLQLCRANDVTLAVDHVIHPPCDPIVPILITESTIPTEVEP